MLNLNFIFYFFRYRKSISSERLVNYHSTVPSHELSNTFTMRLVVACRYDSGGSYMESLHIILNEMYWNSVPRRIMRVCLNRARRYFLGRRSEHKSSWLSLLAAQIYHLLIGPYSYEDFSFHLIRLFHRCGYDPVLLAFEDDVTGVCRFRNHPPRQFHVSGDPINILSYRGNLSIHLFKDLFFI